MKHDFVKHVQDLLGCGDFIAEALTIFLCLLSCLFVVAIIWELIVFKTNHKISDKWLENIAFWLFYLWLGYVSVGGVLFDIIPIREDDNMLVVMVALLFVSIMVARSFALFVLAAAKDVLKACHKMSEAFSHKDKSGQN